MASDMNQTPADLALLETRLPRYTSYPPANRFTTEVAEDARRAWLAALSPDEAVSLYAHVPF